MSRSNCRHTQQQPTLSIYTLRKQRSWTNSSTSLRTQDNDEDSSNYSSNEKMQPLTKQELFAFLMGVFATVVTYEFLGRWWLSLIFFTAVTTTFIFAVMLAGGKMATAAREAWTTADEVLKNGSLAGSVTAGSSSHHGSRSDIHNSK